MTLHTLRLPALSLSVAAAAVLLLTGPAAAQFPGLTQPPSGDNQPSSVTQHIGLVRVTIDYSSPDVHSPTGDDRTGKIWGELVPYGLANLGFGTCGDQCPWRGGANENTVVTVSHDVKVQGQPLPAGAYGLHFIPGQEEWTVVFSKNHTSWGSFTYDAKEDALRVKAKPAPSEYHEWLTYEFTDRQTDKATVALKWEKLQIPFTVTVENGDDLYVERIREELRSSPGFTWSNWNAAAQFALQHKTHLEEGLSWAEQGANGPLGQKNFTTLSTLSQLQAANGKAAEAQKSLDEALAHPTAGPLDLHAYGRSLLAQKKVDEAVKVFQLNAKRHPGVWPVEVGLTRGLAAQGKKKEALAHAKLALAQAPDEGNRKNVEGQIKLLEEGKDLP
jgi:predicted negative regulator of RcsB-dependent stress response